MNRVSKPLNKATIQAIGRILARTVCLRRIIKAGKEIARTVKSCHCGV